MSDPIYFYSQPMLSATASRKLRTSAIDSAESTHDKALFDCREHGLEHGKLDEPRRLPIDEKCFTETE